MAEVVGGLRDVSESVRNLLGLERGQVINGGGLCTGEGDAAHLDSLVADDGVVPGSEVGGRHAGGISQQVLV